jgi:hypothetical protein
MSPAEAAAVNANTIAPAAKIATRNPLRMIDILTLPNVLSLTHPPDREHITARCRRPPAAFPCTKSRANLAPNLRIKI